MKYLFVVTTKDPFSSDQTPSRKEEPTTLTFSAITYANALKTKKCWLSSFWTVICDNMFTKNLPKVLFDKFQEYLGD